MAAQKGRAMVLKIGDGGTSETYTVMGGMRTTTLTINGELVDVTDKDSNAWRELLANAGTKSVTIGGQGVFKDTAAESTAKANALAQSINNYQCLFEDASGFEGAFQMTTLEYSGEYNGARQYSVTLESSGEVTDA